ncbi:universal stress protein [Altibacter sp.]|uniref:universal stress protein n=1 Tax=Altibacter sp. TaxID=2024823 RepID=UPI00258B253A|nr:universal stress protein [Altibacter sp.]MCW9037310.1 universal stress protein [Altibacter sp.]
MKYILLPTDFSVNAMNAITYAMHFFKGQAIHFYVLNVQKTSDYTLSELMTNSPSGSIYEGVLEDNEAKLQELTESLREEYSEETYTFEPLLDYDVFTDAVNQAVVTHNIDLIIMGTNGATNAREVVFGSNTLQVIRKVDCTVLTVPEDYRFVPISSVLLSLNYQTFPISQVPLLKEVLSLHKANLKVLDIKETGNAATTKDNTANLDRLQKMLNYQLFRVKDIPEAMAIKAFEQLMPVELHTVIVEEQHFLDRLLFGSATSKISYESPIPLLIIHC